MNGATLTRIRFRIALWCEARLLPFRISRSQPLSEVLSLASPPRSMRYTGLPTAYILKRVMRTTRRPILMRDRRCLRQGILAFRFMAAAGHVPELHFGVDRTSVASNLKAHCWLVYRGATVLNPPDANMVPILVHTADASSVAPGASASLKLADTSFER
jgi:hypothetical protein